MQSAYYQDYDEPPPPSIWHRLNRLLWVLITLTVVVTIIGTFLPQVQKQRIERDERDRLHRLIEEQRKLHTGFTNQIQWLEHDPEYLGIFARERLDLMKEGETILRVDPPKPAALTPEIPAMPRGPRR